MLQKRCFLFDDGESPRAAKNALSHSKKWLRNMLRKMLTTLCKALMTMSVNETITMIMGIANDSWFKIRSEKKKKRKKRKKKDIIHPRDYWHPIIWCRVPKIVGRDSAINHRKIGRTLRQRRQLLLVLVD